MSSSGEHRYRCEGCRISIAESSRALKRERDRVLPMQKCLYCGHVMQIELVYRTEVKPLGRSA